MFSNLRKTIAKFIAPANSNVIVPAGTRDITYGKAPRHLLDQPSRETTTPMIGEFHVSDLTDMASAYLKDAVAQLGAWSALARAFSEFEKVVGKRVADDKQLCKLFDEFHCWNSATSDGKQMDEDAVALAADKIATVRPNKGSPETDKIIARVRGCSVVELKADREAKAAKASAVRNELLTGFCSAVWSYSTSDMNPSLPNSKVAAKALQTLEWVANNWQGEPAGIAAELLLIEDDLKRIEKAARAEEVRDERQFIDGTLTADGMMKQRA